MVSKPRYFSSNLYYHIYNCGVEKRNTFITERDYERFLETMDFYLYEQRISYIQFQRLNEEAKQVYARLNPKGLETLRVRFICYCLMPNHFHLALKPAKDNSIPSFISDISNSYTRYFNIKNERLGSLFQGTYKSKEIASEESLLQVTRYIHLNPIASSKTNPDASLKLEDYPYSSYRNWIKSASPNLKGLLELDYGEISNLVKLAGGAESYREFVESKIDKDPKLGIEDLIIE